ncbi:ankyrin repeat domain-containing protein [Caulobacter sp. 17J80-11]|uniref:ankyrin repeat domain-containing protein n=1 Tax=Caulobacter sp. 17J80-11 TaxID=2763502 RepID=UPI00165343E9|nr:ankyrin repeat domain-containing protein [Caulobacter sp. 17J80-11]MBC6982226.1 ankyrin repeat domain-containing protein [Caulobacter sp. 17J80-11]
MITEAIRNGSLDQLQRLFTDHPEMVAFRVPGFGTWLHYASAHGTVEIVKHLVSSGFDVNAPDHLGQGRPIECAASKGNVDIVRYLLDCGATLDIDEPVRNPLFGAIIGGSREVADLLLRAGIDSKARYNGARMKDMDAVAFAMMWGHRDIARSIALWNADGDGTAAEAAMAEGLLVAQTNTAAPA